METEHSTEQILKELEPLFVQAMDEKLWFYCNYQDLWFSPKELREKHAEGRFIWGAVNWQLKDPNERVRYLENQRNYIGEQIAELKRRIADDQ